MFFVVKKKTNLTNTNSGNSPIKSLSVMVQDQTYSINLDELKFQKPQFSVSKAFRIKSKFKTIFTKSCTIIESSSSNPKKSKKTKKTNKIKRLDSSKNHFRLKQITFKPSKIKSTISKLKLFQIKEHHYGLRSRNQCWLRKETKNKI